MSTCNTVRNFYFINFHILFLYSSLKLHCFIEISINMWLNIVETSLIALLELEILILKWYQYVKVYYINLYQITEIQDIRSYFVANIFHEQRD